MPPTHPPVTHWERCGKCADTYQSHELYHASTVYPERKRGWFCALCVYTITGSWPS